MHESRMAGSIVVTIAEAARILAISVDTVRRLVQSGKLPHTRIGSSIRLRRTDLDEFVANNTTTQWAPVDGRGPSRSKKQDEANGD